MDTIKKWRIDNEALSQMSATAIVEEGDITIRDPSTDQMRKLPMNRTCSIAWNQKITVRPEGCRDLAYTCMYALTDLLHIFPGRVDEREYDAFLETRSTEPMKQ